MATLVLQERNETWNGAVLGRLRDQCASAFKQIETLAGASAAIVCDNRAAILGAWFNTSLSQGRLNTLALTVTQMFAAHQVFGAPSRDLEIRFDSQYIFARSLGSAIIIVVFTKSPYLSLLRIVLNVGTVGLETDTLIQATLESVAEARTETLTRSMAPSMRGLIERFPGNR
jgi:hypothetical protein